MKILNLLFLNNNFANLDFIDLLDFVQDQDKRIFEMKANKNGKLLRKIFWIKPQPLLLIW